MRFLDKLRGRGEKDDSAKARAEAATQDLSTWLASVMQRLQPDKIQFQPGETLGQVFARIFDEEERAVRAAGDPVVQRLKLESLAKLRQQFPVDSPPGSAPQGSSEKPVQAMKEGTGDRPAEATYEVVLGGQEELKKVPLSMLLELISGWGTVVELVAAKNRLPESLRDEYHGALVTVASGEKNQEELVLIFRGAKEMIQIYRDKMRELGLDQG